MSDELRRAYRYKILPERSEAVLQCPDRRFPVRLLDMSAGGFGAEVEHEIEVEAGQVYVLVSIDAECRVCVTHVRDDGDRKVLGLSYAEGQASPEPETGKLMDAFAGFLRRDPKRSGTSLIGLGLLGAIGLAVLLSGWLPGLDAWTQMLATPGDSAKRSKSTGWITQQSRRSPGDATTHRASRKKSDILAILRLKRKLTGRLREQYTVLTSMISPQAVTDLHLSETQKSKIMQILDSTTRQLTLLDETTINTAPAESDKLLQQSFEQALGELTDEQRRQLVGMLQN